MTSTEYAYKHPRENVEKNLKREIYIMYTTSAIGFVCKADSSPNTNI